MTALRTPSGRMPSETKTWLKRLPTAVSPTGGVATETDAGEPSAGSSAASSSAVPAALAASSASLPERPDATVNVERRAPSSSSSASSFASVSFSFSSSLAAFSFSFSFSAAAAALATLLRFPEPSREERRRPPVVPVPLSEELLLRRPLLRPATARVERWAGCSAALSAPSASWPGKFSIFGTEFRLAGASALAASFASSSAINASDAALRSSSAILFALLKSGRLSSEAPGVTLLIPVASKASAHSLSGAPPSTEQSFRF
mmetsp:Transcript_51402/g.111584  ORF Transcript_51402/g.111584 Transcript_51402/m.111584 type:complete len:262 (-) Transcript_51402:268-1053(-)